MAADSSSSSSSRPVAATRRVLVTGDADDVFGVALALPVRDDGPHLGLGHPGALDASRHRRRRREQQHVPLADEPLGAGLVEDDPAVGQRRHRERQAGRDVRLDHAGDHVDRRALGGEHEVDADGPRHLGDPAHRLLDVARRHHHEVVELVHHDEDERQALPVHGRGHRCARTPPCAPPPDRPPRRRGHESVGCRPSSTSSSPDSVSGGPRSSSSPRSTAALYPVMSRMPASASTS